MTSSRVNALVLAGGLGTRLRPLTDSLPKCLVPICNRALLDFWMDALEAVGVSEVRINNHHLPQVLRQYLQRADRERAFAVTEAFEPGLLGSAGTVAANLDLADDTDVVLVIYGDNLSDVDLAELVSFHAAHSDPVTMLLFRTEYPEKCGIAELDNDGRVTAFVEKPQHPKSDLANAGVYAIDASVYREIAALNAFDFGFDVLPTLVGRMRGMSWDGYHRDVGTPESLQQARNDAPGVFPSCAEAARA